MLQRIRGGLVIPTADGDNWLVVLDGNDTMHAFTCCKRAESVSPAKQSACNIHLNAPVDTLHVGEDADVTIHTPPDGLTVDELQVDGSSGMIIEGPSFGERLREARLASKWKTQKKLAARLRVSRTAISEWEAGHTVPSHENQAKIEKWLNVKVTP